MSKNTYFTGQPVYGQGINLLDRADNHQKKTNLPSNGRGFYKKSILPFSKKHTSFSRKAYYLLEKRSEIYVMS